MTALAPGSPTVLIYNHFDVQPEDPAEGWRAGHPTFPQMMHQCVKDGKVGPVGHYSPRHRMRYNARNGVQMRWMTQRATSARPCGQVLGRGASDNKGGLVGVLAALAAVMKSHGGLPVNVKYIAEGQEEVGSPGMEAWMRDNAARLACDYAFSGDGGTKTESEGLVTVALRGGTDIEITVEGPAVDVHSGMYGGGINNPIHALNAIIASMRSPNGTITVPGFLDKVRQVGPGRKCSKLHAGGG